jgi:hypothetical protein
MFKGKPAGGRGAVSSDRSPRSNLKGTRRAASAVLDARLASEAKFARETFADGPRLIDLERRARFAQVVFGAV